MMIMSGPVKALTTGTVRKRQAQDQTKGAAMRHRPGTAAHRIGRLAVTGLALLSLAACTSSSGTAAANVTDSTAVLSGVPANLMSFYTQQVSWSDCGGGFQCASVS